MWASLSLPWQACLEEAWAAACAGSVPIGAAITDAAGRVIARGRNRCHEPNGMPGTIYNDPLAHAELNALISCQVDPAGRHSYSLYSTTEPCPLCFGAFYMSSLRTLYFAARDPFAGSVNLLGKTPYLSRKPIRVFGPENPALEILIIALYVEFDIRTRGGEVANPVFDALEAVVPQGLALGRQLHRTTELAGMLAESLPVSQVLDRLYRYVDS